MTYLINYKDSHPKYYKNLQINHFVALYKSKPMNLQPE